MEEKQSNKVHVILTIGCADARDLGPTYNKAVAEVKKEYAKEGIELVILRVSAAGSFMTQEMIDEVKQDLLEKTREYKSQGKEVELFVNIATHGEAKAKTAGRIYNIQDIEIIQESRFNCGMLHAKDVGNEMEGLLLDVKPTLEYGGRTYKITSKNAITVLLADVYGNTSGGSLADGGWVTSIEDLRTHPVKQKARLEQALEDDPAFKDLKVSITASIQNYSTYENLRLDGNHGLRTALDEIYEIAKKRMAEHPEKIAAKTAKQKPLIGCFHMSDIPDARESVMAIVNPERQFDAGQVFAMSGRLDDTTKPLDKYSITGFAYSLTHLGLNEKEYTVFGNTAEQAQNMLKRVSSDPLADFYTREFGMKLRPIDRTMLKQQPPQQQKKKQAH